MLHLSSPHQGGHEKDRQEQYQIEIFLASSVTDNAIIRILKIWINASAIII